MKYSDFEKQIGDKLRNEEIHLDTAAFYKTLTAPKKKKRGAIIIVLPFLFAAALIAFFSFGYNNETLIDQDKTTSIKGHESDLKNTNLTNLASQNTKQTNIKKQEKTITENDINESIKSTKIFNSNNTESSQNAVLNIVKNNASPSILAQKIDYNSNQVNVINSNSYINSQSLQSSDAKGLQSIDISDSKISNTSNINFTQEIKIEKVEILDEAIAQNNNSNLQITKVNTLLNGLSIETEKIPISTKIECPDFRIDKKLFNVEVLGEIGYFRPIKDFDPSTINTNEVNVLRNENEASREGYHAGIYAKFIGTRIPIYLQAGISQDYLTERMSIEYSYIERDTTQGIISITESENGDTITAIIGDIIKETEVSGNKIKHYRLQMIDIPLVAGYQFGFNRFSVGLEAGVLFNIRMRSTGSILAATTNFEDVEIQNPFKSSVGMSYLGGISLGYHLSPRSKIYINTKMRFIPDAVNMGGNTLTQKYKFLGLNFGYGYLF